MATDCQHHWQCHRQGKTVHMLHMLHARTCALHALSAPACAICISVFASAPCEGVLCALLLGPGPFKRLRCGRCLAPMACAGHATMVDLPTRRVTLLLGACVNPPSAEPGTSCMGLSQGMYHLRVGPTAWQVAGRHVHGPGAACVVAFFCINLEWPAVPCCAALRWHRPVRLDRCSALRYAVPCCSTCYRGGHQHLCEREV